MKWDLQEFCKGWPELHERYDVKVSAKCFMQLRWYSTLRLEKCGYSVHHKVQKSSDLK